MGTRDRHCIGYGARLIPLALLVACGGGDLSLPTDGDPPPDRMLEPIEGEGQSAPAGSPVPVRPAVRVTLPIVGWRGPLLVGDSGSGS